MGEPPEVDSLLELAASFDSGVSLRKFSPTTATVDLPELAREALPHEKSHVGEADLWAATIGRQSRMYGSSPEAALSAAISLYRHERGET